MYKKLCTLNFHSWISIALILSSPFSSSLFSAIYSLKRHYIILFKLTLWIFKDLLSHLAIYSLVLLSQIPSHPIRMWVISLRQILTTSGRGEIIWFLASRLELLLYKKSPSPLLRFRLPLIRPYSLTVPPALRILCISRSSLGLWSLLKTFNLGFVVLDFIIPILLLSPALAT